MRLGFSPARILLRYGKTARVISGPAKGMRFVAAPGMGLTYAIGTAGAAPRFFRKFIHDGDVVYDVGANKGQMTLIFSRLAGRGHVVSFEPAPQEREYLAENLRLNRISNVSVVPAAAYDASGSAVFLYAPNHPTMGKLESVESHFVVAGSTEMIVQTVTLDSIAATSGAPTFVKLDVEGGAAVALRGARQIIQNIKPLFYIELHGPEEQAGVQKELLDQGYSAYTLGGNIISDLKSGWVSPVLCKP